MLRPVSLVVLALVFGAELCVAQEPAAPQPSEAAKDMAGAWEISNSARDKTCPVTFKLDAAAGGLALEHDCGTVFPSLKGIVAWTMGPDDSVRLIDGKGAVVLDFTEVENGMYEAERKGEGLYFMRSQAAIKDATITPEKLFGDWVLLQEAEKPLCQITLSNAPASAESYQIAVKPGCAKPIADFGLVTWKLDGEDLLLTGNGGSIWRFSESAATVWERIPPSTDPLLLMRK
jgi:Protease inhibitor Inh